MSKPIGREVVVILPHFRGKLLMQLRDEKRSIDYPGHWGLFGGSIESSDLSPLEAVRRELREEVGCCPKDIVEMGVYHYGHDVQLDNHKCMVQYTYACEFSTPVSELELAEGMDFGFFTLCEIHTGLLYSKRRMCSYPVVPNPIMLQAIEQLYTGIDV